MRLHATSLCLIAICSLTGITACSAAYVDGDQPGQNQALFIGDPAQVQYDSPPNPPNHVCDDAIKKGQICVSGVDRSVQKMDPLDIVRIDGDRVHFQSNWGWHGSVTGWVRRSDVAFPSDFTPVTNWQSPGKRQLCDYSGCFNYDIGSDGQFTVSYVDSCKAKGPDGKCPNGCAFAEFAEHYHSPDCQDAGQIVVYRNVYWLRGKSLFPTYLIPVDGKGLCWWDALQMTGKCVDQYD